MIALGWKRDLDTHIEEARMASSARRDRDALRYGSRRLPADYDVLFKHCDVRNQKSSSACFGFAVAVALQARLRLLGYEPGRFSPLAIYAVARQMELNKSEWLDDSGSYPYLGMSGLRRGLSIVPEALWPFDDDYLSRVHKELPFDVFSAASQFRLQSFCRIEDEGEDRVAACMAALHSGHPVLLGMQVGREFEAYRPGRGPVGIETKDTGGHMVFLTGWEDNGDTFIGCNSWSRNYGDDGRFRITRDKLTHPSTSDLYDFVVTTTAA